MIVKYFCNTLEVLEKYLPGHCAHHVLQQHSDSEVRGQEDYYNYQSSVNHWNHQLVVIIHQEDIDVRYYPAVVKLDLYQTLLYTA